MLCYDHKYISKKSLNIAVIDSREDRLSHADFYVACTRISSTRSLLFLVAKHTTKRIVDEKVLG